MVVGLSDLPCEVVSLISSYCGQADTVNFSLTTPLFHEIIISQLYRSIFIDTGPCSLARPYKNIEGRLVPCTVLRTVAGINQFLHVVSSNKALAAKVWAFECRSNVGLSDIQFFSNLHAAFENLSCLSILEWSACPELPPDLFCVLPHPERLQLLRADLAVRPWQSYPTVDFSNLRVLEVRPFLNAQFLQWLSEATAVAPLEAVMLGRFLDSKQEIGSGYRFVGLSAPGYVDVASFFRDKSLKPYKFGVMGAGLSAKVMENVDFRQVEELVLAGCDAAGSSIINTLTGRLPNVTSLRLDWPHWTPAFVKQLNLRNLDLTVKHSPEEAMKIVSNQLELQSLAITMDCSFSTSDLESLRVLTGLRKLTIPFDYYSRTWEIALMLPRLEVLILNYQTFVTGRPSRAHVGLLNTGIYDGWSDRDVSPLQNSAILESLKSHPSLKTVIIDGRTTTFKLHE